MYGYDPYFAPRYAYDPYFAPRYAYDPYFAPRYAYYPQTPVVQQQPEAPMTNHASIRVYVPDGQAKVWFDGNPTKQTGTERFFYTPELAPGKHTYRIRAEWVMPNGEKMIQEQVVSVAPNQTSIADFTRPTEPVPPPK